MKTQHPLKKIKAKAKSRPIENFLKHPVSQAQHSGFCICPGCGHLVFDIRLTGNCPYCHCHFCPSCAVARHRA